MIVLEGKVIGSADWSCECAANKTDPSFQFGPKWETYYSARSSYGSYLDPPHPVGASLNATFWHRVTEVFERNE